MSCVMRLRKLRVSVDGARLALATAVLPLSAASPLTRPLASLVELSAAAGGLPCTAPASPPAISAQNLVMSSSGVGGEASVTLTLADTQGLLSGGLDTVTLNIAAQVGAGGPVPQPRALAPARPAPGVWGFTRLLLPGARLNVPFKIKIVFSDVKESNMSKAKRGKQENSASTGKYF